MTLPAPVYATLPVLAALALVVVMVSAGAGWRSDSRRGWLWAALLSCGFSLWTLHAVLEGGMTGFWPEHQRGAWGNQIWFDLLIAICIGWLLILPRARAVGMRFRPWLIFILCSGGIGLTAMFARLLWLEQQNDRAGSPTFTTDHLGETP